MKIGKAFNEFLSKEQYFHYLENHKAYSDFNTLGLYRSLLENTHLSTADLLEVRAQCHARFEKSFEFLQLKDPRTYMGVESLGKELNASEKTALWERVRSNQEKILKDKKFGHRNFGTYARHECGLPYCELDGLMVRQGSALARSSMCFQSDKNKDEKVEKVLRLKKEKRNFKQNNKGLDLD